MEKRWKNFGNYKVSGCGKVFSLFTYEFLEPQITKDGYIKVDLTLSTGRKKFSVHRLVAMLFVEGFSEDLEVNHKDGNKQNNHYYNLEMVTHAENLKHAWDTGLMKRTTQGTQNIIDATSKRVRCIETGEEFTSLTQAAEFYGISKTGISAQIHGKQKSAGKHKLTGEKLTWQLL